MPPNSLTSTSQFSAQAAYRTACGSTAVTLANTAFVGLDDRAFGYRSGPPVLASLYLEFPRFEVTTVIGGAGDGPFRFHTQGDWRKPLLVRLNRRDYRSHCRGLPGYMALTACSYRQAGRRAHQITSNF